MDRNTECTKRVEPQSPCLFCPPLFPLTSGRSRTFELWQPTLDEDFAMVVRELSASEDHLPAPASSSSCFCTSSATVGGYSSLEAHREGASPPGGWV